MKIIRGQCPACKEYIYSFFRHDFRRCSCGKSGMDGGTIDYVRLIGACKTESVEISEDIQNIRQAFSWGKNYDENNQRLTKTEYNLLQDLTSSHILGILKYFTEGLELTTAEQLLQWKQKHCIFLQELLFRQKQETYAG